VRQKFICSDGVFLLVAVALLGSAKKHQEGQINT
jgi:hypothetical protein